MTPDASPGRPPQVTDGTILHVFREATDPVLATSEVAEALPIKRRATHDRLDDLVNRGELARKRIGKSTVYWLPGQTDTGESRAGIESQT